MHHRRCGKKKHEYPHFSIRNCAAPERMVRVHGCMPVHYPTLNLVLSLGLLSAAILSDRHLLSPDLLFGRLLIHIRSRIRRGK